MSSFQQTNELSTDEKTESPLAFAEYTLRNAKIKNWPYPHTLIKPILPDAYYHEMISAFPSDDAFLPLNEYHPDRGAVFITDRGDGTHDLDRLGPAERAFWEGFVDLFGGDRFRSVLLEMLGGPELVQTHLARTRSLIHLSLDRSGYQIRPHTDVAAKIVTALFYLPDEHDRSLEKFGTTVLLVDEDQSGLDPHDWARYERAFTAPFLANTLFAFRVGNASWHGVEPINKPIRRRSLQFFVILDE